MKSSQLEQSLMMAGSIAGRPALITRGFIFNEIIWLVGSAVAASGRQSQVNLGREGKDEGLH